MTSRSKTPSPIARLNELSIYRPGSSPDPAVLRLDTNEVLQASSGLLTSLKDADPNLINRYPSSSQLESRLAERFGLDPEQVLVTCGADDALFRAFLAMLEPGKELILPQPGFEMLDRYAIITGCTTHVVPWLKGSYPVKDVLKRVSDNTAMIVAVSPNNPTGGVLTVDGLRKLSAEAPHALILLDLAYTEFADIDLTPTALSLPNVIVVRTLSKAWGLAGLRVGYAMGQAGVIDWLRAIGSPYPVSRISLQLAEKHLNEGHEAIQILVHQVREERQALFEFLQARGFEIEPSQGNFVFLKSPRAKEIHQALLDQKVSVRYFGTRPALKDYLRITCPGDPQAFVRLQEALQIALEAVTQNRSGGAVVISEEAGAKREKPSASPREAILGVDAVSAPSGRTCSLKRTTKETQLSVELEIDGQGRASIQTGIGFLDHMLTALSKHSSMNLALRCVGDLEIDDHHTSEDCALALGAALDQALGERRGIRRFGYAYAPLDEAIARVVVDFSGRPHAQIDLGLGRESIGGWATENMTHFFESLANASKCTLHVQVLSGLNDHHRIEAAFKATALALREAMTLQHGNQQIPSTKGML